MLVTSDCLAELCESGLRDVVRSPKKLNINDGGLGSERIANCDQGDIVERLVVRHIQSQDLQGVVSLDASGEGEGSVVRDLGSLEVEPEVLKEFSVCEESREARSTKFADLILAKRERQLRDRGHRNGIGNCIGGPRGQVVPR